VRDGEVREWTILPDHHGLECDDLGALAGGGPAENAARLERLLEGQGHVAERCAVLLNAAAALYVSRNGWTFGESVERARAALESGAGAAVLARLRSAQNDTRRLSTSG
jgi:anthranilate phosphoribosyltransferase